MLRFDKSTLFSLLCKSILSVRLRIKTFGLEVLQFPQSINLVSMLYLC